MINDLFISYAHIDDEPLSPGQLGWISRFHKSLHTFVRMRLGADVSIWRDKKLDGNDIFTDEIVEQFTNSHLFVSVLSPRYIESEWCVKEINEFCDLAESGRGLTVDDNKSRVFKILKLPVDHEDTLPSVTKEVLGYPFFVWESDESPLELDPAYGEEYAQSYNRKIASLAWDIAKILKMIRSDDDPEKPTPDGAPGKGCVYLAECSYDRNEEREQIKAQLRGAGYTVVPDQRLPAGEVEYCEEVQRLLGRCKLSIHVVGASYGLIPDGPGRKSVVALQNEIAAARSRSDDLSRIIWLPEDIDTTEERQQAFLDTLQQVTDTQLGADVVTGDLELLKGVIHNLLERLERESRSDVRGSPVDKTDNKSIYLICGARDRKTVIPLRQELQAAGFDVTIPAFEGDASSVRAANQTLLTSSDAVLVYYGSGDEAWKRTIRNDLKKIPAYRNTAAGMPVVFTFLDHPLTEDKSELLELGGTNLIDGMSQNLDDSLSTFIDSVSSRGAGS